MKQNHSETHQNCTVPQAISFKSATISIKIFSLYVEEVAHYPLFTDRGANWH